MSYTLELTTTNKILIITPTVADAHNTIIKRGVSHITYNVKEDSFTFSNGCEPITLRNENIVTVRRDAGAVGTTSADRLASFRTFLIS